jgi:polysaccharide biosynthesis transport protein
MKQIERVQSELGESIRRPQYVPSLYPDVEAEERSVPPSHYLWIISRHKWRILGFIVACMIATLIVSLRIRPMYQGTAEVDIDRHAPSGIFGQEASQLSQLNDSDQFLATQIELIQSDAVLRPVAARYNLLERERQLENLDTDKIQRKMNSPVLLKKLKITRPANTYVLRISYRSPDPRIAADVANAIAQSYLEHTFNIRVRTSAALSKFMEEQLDDLKAKMERSSMALAQFERELNVINPEEKTNILSARLLQLNTEYTNAQADRVRKEAAFNSMKNGSMAAAQVSSQGEALSDLYDRLNTAKQHFAEVSTTYGSNHSEYRKAANALTEVQRELEDTRRNVAQRIETDYRQAMNREQMLQASVKQTKAEHDQLNARSFEYQQLKREAEADRGLYGDLERRIKEAGINSGFQNNSIRIADLARPPYKPVFPKTGLNLLLAFLFSTIIAIGAAILTDVLDDTVRDPEQVARALDTAVIGTLPTVKEMKRLIGPATQKLAVSPSIVTSQQPVNGSGIVPYNGDSRGPAGLPQDPAREHSDRLGGYGYKGISSYEESIRTLRNSILLPDFDRRIKSILITSAAPGEGKSTTAIHLAIAHAEQGKRTLIVDADLRRPSIHKKLGLSGVTGLSNVLLGDIDWKHAVLKTEHWPDLHVLPAGTASRRASDLIGSMMIDILDEASKEYDLILVDAPPLLGFAEAMQIAAAVDGVVVLTRAGQTSRKAVATLLATLDHLRGNVIGLVLNEVNKNSSNGYYYYGYYRDYYSPKNPTV